MPLWLPNGVVIRDELEKFMKELEFLAGYQRVMSPHIAKEEFYQQSGHLPYYQGSMFPAMELENVNYRLRPMCCPHHHKIFDSSMRSYKELPLRLAEYGQVYRYELSGALSGLMRVRGLCQNDAHIYCSVAQVKNEIRQVIEMYQHAYKVLGILDYRLRLSKWDASNPEKYQDKKDQWEWAEGILREVLVDMNLRFDEEAGEAAFYGPKIDVQLKNIYGKEESASSVQLDFMSAERFILSFINEKGEKERPVIVHRAPLGSHERFVAFLIEKYKGAMPLWLSPIQVQILPIADRHQEYAKQVWLMLHNAFVRVNVDNRVESLNRKIKDAKESQAPYIIVIGDQEVASGNLSVQVRGSSANKKLSPKVFLDEVRLQIADRIIAP
ncbi:threonine--tRNA ligase [Bdellovibrio sp. SKB1291214]|uniref:threonine--tRNA ligase n=1 Tax=Bdellovibrio sp. SKB1291214 TaxID=1732569 RepID=UPI0020CF6BB0|nr:threonine--tRNA ligase [Bdellovibrio sp. SKB1291214]UYL07942.1 threonine--tRNA ligase [Bdellovibrio sp. SKB1291214]